MSKRLVGLFGQQHKTRVLVNVPGRMEPHQSFGHDLVGQYWALDLENED
jgi:hypothetical protein